MIFESSVIGLFRFILLVFIVYYVISLLMRYIVPQLVRNSVRNFYNGNKDENSNSQQRKPNKEGEITIEYIDDKTKPSKENSDDEYVDFEEIK
jgi:hypothetical protein